MENVKNSLEVLGNYIPVLFIILITIILTSIIICFVCENPSNDTKTKNEDHDTHYIEEKPGKTDCTDDYIWIILAMVFVILIFHH